MKARLTTSILALGLAGLTSCADEIFGPLVGGQECDPCTSDPDCDESIGLMCIFFPDMQQRCGFSGSSTCGVTLRIQPGPELTASGEYPWAAAADYDGDGTTDLALIPEDGDASGIEVRLAGAADRRAFVALGDTPTALAAVDVDGDSQADLLSISADARSMTVLRGAGDGTFDASSPIDVGIAANVIVAADVNRDGQLDVIIGSTASRNVAIALQRDGSFEVHSRFATPQAFDRLLVVDANADGTPDLMAYDSTSRRNVAFHGRGNGSFDLRWPPR